MAKYLDTIKEIGTSADVLAHRLQELLRDHAPMDDDWDCEEQDANHVLEGLDDVRRRVEEVVAEWGE